MKKVEFKRDGNPMEQEIPDCKARNHDMASKFLKKIFPGSKITGVLIQHEATKKPPSCS